MNDFVERMIKFWDHYFFLADCIVYAGRANWDVAMTELESRMADNAALAEVARHVPESDIPAERQPRWAAILYSRSARAR